VERFLSFIAMEMMVWHWDGYAMKKNNYRVYHDPESDKLVFFAHGMDQMFWEPEGRIIPANPDGLVARAILESIAGRRRYRDRAATLLTNVFKVDVLTNRMNQVQARIRPLLAAISQDTARNHDGAINNLRDAIVRRAASLARQLSVPEAKPLKFDSSGIAALTLWRQQDRTGNAALDKPSVPGKPRTLHIVAGADKRCTASWRTTALLEPGHYEFEGQVRTAGVVPLTDQKGEGAGLRISGSQTPRPNKLVGDSPWQKLEYDFTVPAEAREIELLCELRAVQGEAWFDLESLRVVRKGSSQ
jgi:hypothetical protein